MRLLKTLPWFVLAAAAAGPAFAQEAAGGAGEAVEVPAEVVAQMDKGDVAWMIMATILVLLMIVPGLALFYGGLVRAKNMLSVLMQCFVVTCVMMIVWVRLRLQPGAERRRRLRRLYRRLLPAVPRRDHRRTRWQRPSPTAS